MQPGTLGARLTKVSRGAKAARAAWDDARATRDHLIRTADAAGMGTREIARWTELEPSTVLYVLAQQQDPA